MEDAVSRSFGDTPDSDPDADFIHALRHSGAVFAAFKVHRAQNDIARLLLDSNGDLKPFEQWSKEVLPIASHQMGPWLRTEYDTAVTRAARAADWRQFEREKDVLPNLRWMPSTSATPGEDHRRFWGVVRPVDDPFWNEHRPGDRWNCKCSLSSTDDPPTQVPVALKSDNPQPGLEDNPGKSARLFSDSHPYFPDSCSSCPFSSGLSGRAIGFFAARRRKDCCSCRRIDKRIEALTDPVKRARRAYYDLKHDPEYRDVRFDKKSGGVIATHIGHNDNTGRKEFFNGTMSGADLERECAEQLFRNGHKVVFCDESKMRTNDEKYCALDMMLDDEIMEIRSITGGKGWYVSPLLAKNKQIGKYNDRPDVDTPAETVCLYFHDPKMFNEEKLRISIKRFKFFRDYDNRQIKVNVKRVYVILNGEKDIRKYGV